MNTTELDSYQQAAVACDAPLVVVTAAPGSGKSRTLVARVRRLLDGGVEPEKICCLTYTCAGSRVMQERVAAGWVSITTSVRMDNRGRIDPDSVAVKDGPLRLGYCGTLHAFLLRLLQRHGQLVGLPEGVSVMDEDEAHELLLATRERLRVKCTDKELVEAVATLGDQGRYCAPKCTLSSAKAQIVALEYWQTMRTEGCLSFDAVLSYGLTLLRNHPELAPFDHLLVDEVQDSSAVDFDIYDAIPAGHKFFVGDADQSIFQFRGAAPARFRDLAFRPEAVRFGLSVNYRSARHVIKCAGQLISHSEDRIGDLMQWRHGAPWGSVEFLSFPNTLAELSRIAQVVGELGPGTTSAVLWRTNAMAKTCRDHLRGLGVKVAERASRSADDPAVALAKAALAFVASPFNDRVAARYAKAMGWHVSELALQAQQQCCSMSTRVRFELQRAGHAVPDAGSRFGAKELSDRMALMLPNYDTTRYIVELASTLPEPLTVGDLLVASREQEDEPVREGDGVYVGTAHSSKGTEYDVVVIGGMEQEVWPGRGDVAEERRLAYVACTRARTRLVVSHCASRPAPFAAWKTEPRTPSQFVQEMTL